MNTLLCAILNKIVALKHGVALNLVSSRDDISSVDEGLELGIQLASSKEYLRLCGKRTCSIVWLETPIERALLLGSLVMADMS